MRLFVLLALALVSGCNANFFHANAPKPPMEALTDAFWDYIAKASKTADDTVEMVMKSQFGSEVNAHLAETADVASRYASTLKEKLPLAAQGLMAQISAEANALRDVLSQDLSSVSERFAQYSVNVKLQIEEKVNRLKQELSAYADNIDSDSLKEALKQRSEELVIGLMQQVDDQVSTFQHNIRPIAKRVQRELYHVSRGVGHMIAPYAEDLKETLGDITTDFNKQLNALVNNN